VKGECEALQREFSTRTELLTSGLQGYGFTYRVVLDHELAKQPRLDNAKTCCVTVDARQMITNVNTYDRQR
jgi:hypothetical protein